LSYPQKRSKTPIILFGGGAAAVIVILLIFFLTQNNDNSVEKVTTSTIENNTKPQENKQPVKEPSTTTESQPVETVRSFISELGNRDFYSAYNRQNNKSWGDYSFFSSTKSFGGIRSTTIESISLNYENHGEASVYIDYTANDPSNKNGRYKQDFFLKKIGGEWKIVKVKNISIEQW
jgi:hypothetical protein